MAAGATAAATVAAPAVQAQQGPISMRFQSTWPSKDIFHEYALDFAKKVNDMTGGDLKIEVLPAGAVVPAFQLLDAVSKGVLDGGHGVLVYHYGKQHRAGAVGLGPGLRHGRQHAARLAQVRRRQGTARRRSSPRSAPTSCRSRTGRCYRSRSAGSRSRSQSVDDFKGLKYRTVGISIDLFTGMGAAVNALPGGEIVAAMDRGLLDAAEFNNASSDRALGFADVSKICMLQSYHQNAEQFEITLQQDEVRRAAAEDAGDHRERRRSGLAGHVVEGDRSLLAGLHRAADQGQRQVLQDAGRDPASASSSSTTRSRRRTSASNPLFKEIVESQLAFAKRATRWEQDYVVNRKMAFDHYFGPNAKTPI